MSQALFQQHMNPVSCWLNPVGFIGISSDLDKHKAAMNQTKCFQTLVLQKTKLYHPLFSKHVFFFVDVQFFTTERLNYSAGQIRKTYCFPSCIIPSNNSKTFSSPSRQGAISKCQVEFGMRIKLRNCLLLSSHHCTEDAHRKYFSKSKNRQWESKWQFLPSL